MTYDLSNTKTSDFPLDQPIGIIFKTAREKMGWTIKDVAYRLHLKPSIIEMLESNLNESNLPLIFVRGYYRSYAKLLNLSNDVIVHLLAYINVEMKPIETKSVTSNIRKSNFPVSAFLLIIPIALLILLKVAFFHSNPFSASVMQANSLITESNSANLIASIQRSPYKGLLAHASQRKLALITGHTAHRTAQKKKLTQPEYLNKAAV